MGFLVPQSPVQGATSACEKVHPSCGALWADAAMLEQKGEYKEPVTITKLEGQICVIMRTRQRIEQRVTKERP